ncbi:hypothetical protein [Luteimonas aquatica]|uniref:hypothetical protein n=1 Tax=Luteimonas aquatica TaxID=450364 RepID=UPI001F58B3AE|nr:hypothetical protein [Luteimonas aquatica]
MSKALLSTALATVLAGAAVVPAATAAPPAAGFERFQYCPYETAPMQVEGTACVHSITSSGSFTIGSTTLPIDKPIVLQGGITGIQPSPLYEAVGAPTLNSPPGKVPGGLLGIVNPAPDWPFFLWQAFWNIVNSVNDVTATMEPVQTIQTDFGAALNPEWGGDPTAVKLALRVRLQNPFLGNTCYIGSAQNPIVVKLQTGTTAPPAPTAPISGSPGSLDFIQVGNDPYAYFQNTGNILVDNSFAVPAAKGCGNIALGLPILTQLLDALVSGAVNLKVGLPSAAGKNEAILKGDTGIAAADYVRNGSPYQ